MGEDCRLMEIGRPINLTSQVDLGAMAGPSTWLKMKSEDTIMKMYVLGRLSRDLMTVPVPGKPGMAVGPPWEWIDISAEGTPACQVDGVTITV